jgi:hypothetical protein
MGKKEVVNIESISNKRYFVARDTKGSFLGRKAVKGSQLTLNNARVLYSQGGTFSQDRKREIYTSKNFKEITVSSSTYKGDSYDKRTYAIGNKPKGSKVQYVCSGIYKGKPIISRSRFIDSNDPRKARNASEAKREARDSFLGKLGQAVNESATGQKAQYDADEGKSNIEDVEGYREGWVYYVAR